MSARLLAVCGLLWGVGLGAQEAITNAPVRQISENIYQIGNVQLDKAERTVVFPAQLNLTNGLMEYFLVTTNGKAYESLLTTEAQPYQIHLAMLLLGARGAPVGANDAPSTPFHVNRPAGDTNPPPPGIAGDPITIEMTWSGASGEKRLAAEDCFVDLALKKNAPHGVWTYNGSRVIHGGFIAQRDGSIVALVDDYDAMANNPRPGHDNDQIWEIDTNAIPPVHTAVEIRFTLKR